MTKNRIQILIAIMALVILPVGTWLLGISPMQTQISDARSQTAAADALNNRHGATLDGLKSAASNLTALKSRLATLDAAVPTDPNIAVFLAEVGRLGKSCNVSVMGFTAGTEQATGAAATPASSTSATAAPATSSGSTAAASATSSIPVTLQVQGTAKHVRAFVGALQSASRLFVVTSLSITSSSGSDFSAALSGNAFVATRAGASAG